MDIMKYKQFEGTADVDMDRAVCHGKILFIDDLVTYEAPTPDELRRAFQEAVDDYLDTCAELGRDPQVPLKGVFNVRVHPSLHRAAVLRSVTDNVSLNEIVVRALDAYVNTSSVVNNHVEVTLTIPEGTRKAFSSATDSPHWETAHVH